jgi:hypothetical protein
LNRSATINVSSVYLVVCPELLVSAAPVSHSLESLALVEREGEIDVGNTKNSHLGRLEDGNRLVVEVE